MVDDFDFWKKRLLIILLDVYVYRIYVFVFKYVIWMFLLIDWLRIFL